jgi:hypothetical protein
MKKIGLSIAAFACLNTLVYAGGDIMPVEPATATPVVVEDEHDDDGFYVGLAYAYMSHDADRHLATSGSETDFSGAAIQLGYKFNQYVAVEGRYAMSIGGANEDYLQLENEEMNVMGLYVKPMYPISPELDIYALLGYAVTDFSNDGNVYAIDSEGGFSWGLGGSMDLTEDVSLFVDYAVYYDDTLDGFDYVVDGFNVGASYRF